jgi:hypothetical protein
VPGFFIAIPALLQPRKLTAGWVYYPLFVFEELYGLRDEKPGNRFRPGISQEKIIFPFPFSKGHSSNTVVII